MTHRRIPAGRALTVIAVCASAVALPAGIAEASNSSQTPESVVSIGDCGSGLTVTIGGGSLVGVNLPGDDCPTDGGTPTPTPSASSSPYPICTLPPPPTTPPASKPPAPTPTPKPRLTPVAVPIPRAAQPSPSPPAPVPTPTPTPPRPTPKAPAPKPSASTRLVVPVATTFHTVPFKRMSTVVVIFLVAVVPVSIARIRHRRR